MSYGDLARTVIKRLNALSHTELVEALRAIEKGLNRRTSKVRGAARRSMKDEAAAADTLRGVEKELERLKSRKKFDDAATVVGREILRNLHVLMRGVKPYGDMGRICRRFNALNSSLSLVTEGTEAAGFLEAARRFRRDAHHILKGSLVDDKRVKALLQKLNRHVPDRGAIDFAEHSRMPTVALTTDVHIASQAKLAAKGEDRLLDADAFSAGLDTAIAEVIPADGKVSLEKIVEAHHKFYQAVLPTYGDAKADDAMRALSAYMEQLIVAARKVDAE